MRARTIVARHVVPAVFALFFVAPLLFMVLGSLRPSGLPPPVGVEVVPPNPTLESYARVRAQFPNGGSTFFGNSLVVVAVAVPLTILVASLAGFGIRLLPPPSRRRAILLTVVLLLIPVTAVWATRFQLFRMAGVVETYVPLIAPALAATNPFYVLIYAWAFAQVPDDQLDAARLEGASALTMWRRVALPQVRAATLAVAVLAFTFHWSNFIDPLLYVHRIDRYTLPLGARFLQQFNPTDWPLMLAGAVLLTLPVVGALLLAQRLLFDDPRRIVRRST